MMTNADAMWVWMGLLRRWGARVNHVGHALIGENGELLVSDWGLEGTPETWVEEADAEWRAYVDEYRRAETTK